MRKLVIWLKERSATELLLLGTVIILIFLIVMRWGWIQQEVKESFSRLFRIEN